MIVGPRFAVVLKTLRFGSGRIAIKRGERVRFEFYNETVWIYDIPNRGATEKLLYTFNSRHEARQYLDPEKVS